MATLQQFRQKARSEGAVAPAARVRRPAAKSQASKLQSRIGHAGFVALTGQVARTARRQAKPGPGDKLLALTQKAAIKQQAEAQSRAAKATLDQLELARTGAIEALAFKQALTAKLAQVMVPPKTPAEAQKALDRSTAQGINAAMRTELATRQRTAVGALPAAAGTAENAADHMPDAPPQLTQHPAGARPGAPDAAGAVPPPLPDAALDTSGDRAESDAQYASEGITQTQLRKSNEPSFVSTAQARDEAETHSAAGPQQVREAEAGLAGRALARGSAILAAGMNALGLARMGGFGAVFGQQKKAKSKEELERERVSERLQAIQRKTREDVESTLSGMENHAAFSFNIWLDYALASFDARREKLEKQIRQRRGDEALEGGNYLGALFARWGDLDSKEVEEAIRGARIAYDEVVARGIDQVAHFVGRMLAAAKRRIANGKQEAADFVKGLRGSVKAFGVETLQAINDEFEVMAASVDSRRDGLIDRLGDSYAESQRKVEEHAQAFRDANKSFWQRLKEKVKGVIRAIRQMKDLFFSILARAAGIIGDLLSDPGGFLSTLVDGAKRGFLAFCDKIGEYLEKALFEWMFGQLAASGLQLPERYDAKGIFGVIAGILGLTYANVRSRAVRLLGEQVVAGVEGTAEVFRLLVREGPGALWDMLAPKLEATKDQAIAMIKDLLIVKVIKAGVMWVLSLFNPVSGFIKACKAIYAIVMFFVERAAQVVQLIEAVLDGLSEAASGNAAAVARRVETALASGLSLVIGLLASVLGLGGMGSAIRGVVERIRAPVDRAIEWLLRGTLGVAKAVGKAVSGRLAGGKARASEKKPAAPDQALAPGDVKAEAKALLLTRLRSDHARDEAIAIVDGIETELRPHGLKSLTVSEENEDGASLIEAVASPKTPLGELLSGVKKPRGRSVTSLVQLTLGDPVNVGSHELAPSDPSKSTVHRGGAVWTPGAGHARQVNVVTWNTSNINAPGNSSHAEHQFVHYMEQRRDLWPRIEKIEIVNRTRSPCSECGDELAWLLKEIRRERGQAPVAADIYWTKLHAGRTPQPTSWQTLHILEKQGWRLHAPAGELPPPGGFHQPMVHVILL